MCERRKEEGWRESMRERERESKEMEEEEEEEEGREYEGEWERAGGMEKVGERG